MNERIGLRVGHEYRQYQSESERIMDSIRSLSNKVFLDDGVSSKASDLLVEAMMKVEQARRYLLAAEADAKAASGTSKGV